MFRVVFKLFNKTKSNIKVNILILHRQYRKLYNIPNDNCKHSISELVFNNCSVI